MTFPTLRALCALMVLALASCQSQRLYELADGLGQVQLGVQQLASDVKEMEDSGDGRWAAVGGQVDNLLRTVTQVQGQAQEAAEKAEATENALAATAPTPITGNPLIDSLLKGGALIAAAVGGTNHIRDKRRRQGTAPPDQATAHVVRPPAPPAAGG